MNNTHTYLPAIQEIKNNWDLRKSRCSLASFENWPLFSAIRSDCKEFLTTLPLYPNIQELKPEEFSSTSRR